MSIREMVNRHQGITIAISTAVVLVAVVIQVSLSSGRNDDGVDRPGGRAFFSDDDGKTWFVDDVSRVPPFDHNGKPAYRVYVFRCDKDGEEFAAFLSRYTPETKAKLEEAKAQSAEFTPGAVARGAGLEVKRPGEAQWVQAGDLRAAVIQQPACPHHPSDAVIAVTP